MLCDSALKVTQGMMGEKVNSIMEFETDRLHKQWGMRIVSIYYYGEAVVISEDDLVQHHKKRG